MKAVCIREPGGTDQLEIRKVLDPEPAENQVQLDAHATALNRADLLQRRGLYPPPKGETDIMGLECSGVVSKVGAGVSAVGVGDRVMALLPGGGYAEKVVIPEHMAIPIPERFDFYEAAAIPEAFLTAREGLFTLGRLAPGDTVLVHAAGGGVGSAAVQLAHTFGAQVVATAGSPEKLGLAKDLGADYCVNYRTEDFAAVVKEATAGKGANVVLDFIGGSYWEKHTKSLATAGRLVVIGIMGGAKVTMNFGQLLSRRWQVLGLVMRARPVTEKIAITRAFVRESLPALADGQMRPVVDRIFAMDDVVAAQERMEANENLGKIVLAIR